MALDWNTFNEAMATANSTPDEALLVLERLETTIESDIERAVLLSGKATCYGRLGRMHECLAFIVEAKALAKGDRLVTSLVELSEASHRCLTGQAHLACEQFARLSAEYADLLANPEHHEIQQELTSRYGCALVDAERFDEAISMLRRALSIAQAGDVQRLRLYLGIALAAVEQHREAQAELTAATAGADSELSKMALDRLATLTAAQ